MRDTAERHDSDHGRRRRVMVVAAGLVVPALVVLAGCSMSRSVTPPTTTTTTTTLAPTTTTSTTTSTTTTSTSTTTSTTTTTIPTITEGAVVLVANASGIDGAAARLSDQLGQLGFHMARATNAAGNEASLATSKVYFLPAGEAVARSVARKMGNLPLFPMPTPAWITGGTAALGDATVLVMLGSDIAGKNLGELTPA